MRLEFRRVKYRVRGVPQERLRMVLDLDDGSAVGSIIGTVGHVQLLLSVIEAGARQTGLTLDIINDPRQDRPPTNSKL